MVKMTSQPDRRRRSALASLTLGGFAIGLTEFVAIGLLPQIARDVLPAEYAESRSSAVAHAGWVITAYALGVVVGAPTIAALTARVPRRRLVLALLVLLVAGTCFSALAPTFALVVFARFVAGLPHGAYFGAAGLLASDLLGPGSRARGFAAVLSGLTAANIVGVPLITWLGQSTSWRVAYLAIAGVFLLTLLAVAITVPETASPSGGPDTPVGSIGAELAALRRPQVWLVALVAMVGIAGFFCVYSYIAPVTTQVAGLGSAAVPWVLAAIGTGMTIGNVLGGIAADRDLRRTMLLGFCGLIAALVFFGLAADTTVGVFVGACLVGAGSLFLAPALQARLIAAAPDAELMGAAVNQSATNLANSIGAAAGGFAIGAGYGYLSPAWAGVAFTLIGLALAALSFRSCGHVPGRRGGVRVRDPNSSPMSWPG